MLVLVSSPRLSLRLRWPYASSYNESPVFEGSEYGALRYSVSSLFLSFPRSYVELFYLAPCSQTLLFCSLITVTDQTTHA